ncbi:MAG: hypothetical protein WC787_01415 [Patescibacteria group bacterium]|jgi:dihydroorotate dehydrogenase
MHLRGINYGHVIASSGTRGFFDEGYTYHKLPIWKGGAEHLKQATFVAKTVTLHENVGNMPLTWTYQPRDFMPKCIVVKPFEGAVLNAVGLSNFGIKAMLADKRWQERTDNFFISFMCLQKTAPLRLAELRTFVTFLIKELPNFKGKVALEINYSCPNVGLHQDELVSEVTKGLEIASVLNIPLVPNFNALLPVEAAIAIAQHEACDAVSIANSIPWGAVPDLINWEGIFGSKTSPLAHLGGGGLSGAPILNVTLGWLQDLNTRRYTFAKPLVVGGGILSAADAELVLKGGYPSVRAIKLGVVALLRPWNIKGILRGADAVFHKPGLSAPPAPLKHQAS